ncbi:XRE family transcriptional regulator [Roseococcus sp. SYP-B2431]|uniref:helix-turn-helix domain-containing protein n=1 Tax=Roseococcus sp. SYP-B2431 TaxID=2496640 RepID=UPI00103A47B2|nr:helix-turn-helix transcriptional regulator [Roseococcus sp. SYP-B2431]TCI00819.1 XRE family transcriptional regulator [Roseococcus sp. SYP-B2431]
MLDRTPFSLRHEIRLSPPPPARPAPPAEAPSSRSPTHDDGKVGRRIKDIRRKLGLTQKQVAGRVGVTGAQFHRYEVGATRVAASRLMAIATVLGVRPEALMSDAALPAERPANVETPATDALVELVELFSSLQDDRRRRAVLGFARSVAASPPCLAAAEA